MNRRQKLIAAALATAGVAGFAIAGQYAGGALFAKLQQLPDSAVGIFTLHDYWHAYGYVRAERWLRKFGQSDKWNARGLSRR